MATGDGAGTGGSEAEQLRLAVLRSYGILDSPVESIFEDLVDLAAAVCGVPMAAVTLVDSERQWFKSQRGLGCAETPRDTSFCSHAIADPTELMVVADAQADPRFVDNPLVTGPPHIRFYAGVPLVTPEGLGLGALCVLDHVPRQLEPEQVRALRAVARQVLAQLELRRARLLLDDAAGSREAFEQAPTSIALVSLEGDFLQVNAAFSTLTGVPASEAIGRPFRNLAHPLDLPELEHALASLLSGEASTILVEARLLHPAGGIRWVRVSASLARDDLGAPAYFVCHGENIDGARQAASREVDIARMIEAIVSGDRASSTLMDSLGSVLHIVATALGWPVGRARVSVAGGGGPAWDTTWHVEDPIADAPLRAGAEASCALDGDPWLSEVERSGRTAWIEDAAADSALGRVGEVRGTVVLPIIVEGAVVGVLQWWSTDALDVDATTAGALDRIVDQVGRMVERWYLLAQRTWDGGHDALTGLANRGAVRDHLEGVLDAATPRGVTVLCCGLEGLGLVNEAYGYAAGNEVLRAAAERLRTVGRTTDVIGRLGGKEFVLVAAGWDSDEDLQQLGRRVIEHLARPYHAAGQKIYLGCSVGIAGGRGERQAAALLEDGLAALRAVRGTGTARRQPDAHRQRTRSADRLAVDVDLHHALERAEFRLLYQPIVELDSGRVVGAEALLRWEHPQRGLLAPAEFLGALEGGSLMVPVGVWVLATACMQLDRWREEFAGLLDGFDLHINASVVELQDPGYVAAVADALAASGVSPEAITIELTETVFANDPDHLLAVLLELQALGVQLAIDDFGTGFSSLSYLQRFPITTLKIDKVFVDAIRPGQDQVPAIAGTVIDLARSMGVGVVAEGIERAEQAAWLHRRGCALGQGYHFAQPLAADELSARLRADGCAGEERAPTLSTSMTVAAAPPSIRQMLAELAGLVGFGAAFVSRICGGTHEIVEVADAHGICPRPGTTLSLDLTCFGRPSAGAPGDLSCLALLEPLGIRSYALAPLRGDAGSLVGTLVLLDRTDVELTDRSRTALDLFASMLSRQQQDSAVQAERDDGRRSIAGRERRGRLRLAAQLHDGPIQQVVAARLLLEGAAGPAPSSGIRAAVEAMDQGILELRELLGAVQPGTLDAAELTESLSSAARNVNPGAKILIRVPDDPDGPDMVVMGELHRMALELLTNVRKHANGELRHFAFVVRDGRAVVRVVDAGPGGCPQRSPQGHYGLSSLQETARLLGGAVMVRSGAIGTTVTVRVAA